MTDEWRNYAETSQAPTVAIPLVAFAITRDRVNRHEEAITMTNKDRIRKVLLHLDASLTELYKVKCRSVSPVTQTLILAQQQIDDARETVFQAVIQTK